MNCRGLDHALLRGWTDEGPRHRRGECAAHLVTCGDCRVYVDTYERTVRETRAAFAESEPTKEEVEAVMGRIMLDLRLQGLVVERGSDPLYFG